MKIFLQAVASVALCIALSVLAFCGDLISDIDDVIMTAEESSRPYYENSLTYSGSEINAGAPHPIGQDKSEENEAESGSFAGTVESDPAYETAPPVVVPPEESSSSQPESSSASSEVSSPSGPPPAVDIENSSSSGKEESQNGSSTGGSSQTESGSSVSSSESLESGSSLVPSSPSSSAESSSSSQENETLWVTMNGSTSYMDAYEAVCMVTEAEVGYTFSKEAIKAQAVAAYTYIKYYNAAGSPASVPGKTATDTVKQAVAEVMGQAVYYNGKYAFTPYCACSAGKTAASSEVWGGSFSYLVSVESKYDPIERHKNSIVAYTQEELKTLLEKYTGLTLDDSAPEDWIHIDSTAAGGYVLKVTITGKNGVKQITGRNIRENILSYRIKSHAFTLTYANGIFTFTTNGYGHGVGMSQTGANGYAVNDGWSYRQILEHYYPGTSVY